MNLIFNRDIQQQSEDRNRKVLLELKNYIGKNVSVIYIYSLVDSKIPYPKEAGNILYIGEACRKDATGIRFSQHIGAQKDKGMNSNVNYALHSYYWKNEKMNLKIYEITKGDESTRKNIEKCLINSHVKKYGATPICQGASGYKISEVNNLDTNKVYIDENEINIPKII